MTVVGSGRYGRFRMTERIEGSQWTVKSDSKEAKGYSMGKSGASGSKMANFMMDGAKIRSVWGKMKTVIQFFL